MDNNPDSQAINYNSFVVIDNGYADHKAVRWLQTDDGTLTIVESLYPSRAIMGASNISIDGQSTGVYRVNEQDYTVSPNVKNPISIRGKQYSYSDLNTVLVAHSLIAEGFGGQQIVLGTGLPFDQCFKNGQRDEILQQKVTTALKIRVEPRSGDVPAIIEHHYIFPEAVAAFADWAMDVDGNRVRQIESGIAIVDIGGNTTDVTSIDPDNNIDLEHSGTLQQGVLNVKGLLEKLLCSEYEVDSISPTALEKAIRTNECPIFGQIKNVSCHVAEAKRQTTKIIMNFVTERIGDAANVDCILLVGGGAECLKEALGGYPHVVIPDRPQFANARGMLKFMTYVKHESQ